MRKNGSKTNPSVTTLEQKLGELAQRTLDVTDSHARKLTAHDTAITGLSRGVGKLKRRTQANGEGVASLGKQQRIARLRADRQQSQLDRHGNMLRVLDSRVVETHDRVVQLEAMVGVDPDTLQKALKAGSTGGERSFIRTLRSKGVSDDDIRKAFSILKQDGDGELDFDNADAFGELFREFVSFRETTQEQLDAVEGKVDIIETQIASARGDIVELSKTVKAQSGKVPLFAWIIAAALGLAGFLWWLFRDWGTVAKTVTSTVKTDVGTATVDNTLTMRPAGDHWYFALLFGVAIFLVVLGLVSLFTGVKKTETTTTSTTSQNGVFRSLRAKNRSRREAAKAQKAQQRANGAQLLNNTTSTSGTGVMSHT